MGFERRKKWAQRGSKSEVAEERNRWKSGGCCGRKEREVEGGGKEERRDSKWRDWEGRRLRSF